MFWLRYERAAVLMALVVGCAGAPARPAALSATLLPTATLVPTPAPAATAAPTTLPSPATAAPTEATGPLAGLAAASVPGSASALPALAQQAAVAPTTVPAADPLTAAQVQPQTVDTTSPCDDTSRPGPLPAPGSARSSDFFRSFREPLAPAPLYDPPGPKRVGLQAGHWLTDQVPPELGRLQGGSVGGGKQEWQVNLDVAQRTAALLEATGVQVDVLPATIPPRYQANAFIAIHADGDPAGLAHGFKVARPGFSSLPDVDDRLVDTLNQVYGAATALPRDDDHISLRMRYYYAFNSRRYCHAVATGVPQAIMEMGYLTSATDRQYLIGTPDLLARGLADGIQTFLSSLP